MAITKVLVVDDSPIDIAFLTDIVSNAGYVVITAMSGQEAINKAKSEAPDLIFMDVIMQGTDGFEACRSIVKDETTKNIPIVFVTGKNQKADKVWAELQGGKALIGKPYTADQIVDQINALN